MKKSVFSVFTECTLHTREPLFLKSSSRQGRFKKKRFSQGSHLWDWLLFHKCKWQIVHDREDWKGGGIIAGADSADGTNLCVEKNRGPWMGRVAQITNKVRPSLPKRACCALCLLCPVCVHGPRPCQWPHRPTRLTDDAISCHSG
jgi:hypothetical protein